MCQCPNLEQFAEAMRAIIDDVRADHYRKLSAVAVTSNSVDESLRLFEKVTELTQLKERLDEARKHGAKTSQANVYISKEDAARISAHIHVLRDELQEQFRELNNFIKNVCR